MASERGEKSGNGIRMVDFGERRVNPTNCFD